MDFELPRGVWPTMVTPFTPDGDVDFAGLKELVEWYVAKGVDGLFAVCQSSEMFFLSREERVSIATSVVETVAGRCGVIASGHTSEQFDEQLEDVSRVADTGVDAVVLLSNRPAPENATEEEWIAGVQKLLKCIPPNVPLGLYECPYPYKRLVTAKELTFLASTDRFFFLKDTCCDLPTIEERSRLAAGTSMALYNANSATLLESLRLGYAGFSGVMANFHPELYSDLCTHFRDDPDAAEYLQDRLGVFSLAEGPAYPVNAKYHLQLSGVPIGLHCRSKDPSVLDTPKKRVMQQLKRTTDSIAAQRKHHTQD